MRQITEHQVNKANEQLEIFVEDDPIPFGASSRYLITGFNAFTNAAYTPESVDQDSITILFQNGSISETGVNGITHEALIAIILDRLRAFQDGQFKCRENALAITKLEEAQHWLLHRTNKRLARGVEGTHQI